MRCDGTRSGAGGLGRLFLISIVIHITASLLLSVLESKGFAFPTEVLLAISELTMVTPAVVYILIKKLGFRNDLGFRPIKAGTFFMCILLTVLVSPVASFVNVLSQFFVNNKMLEESGELLGADGGALLFMGALFGPLCEEFVFRGVFYKGYEELEGPVRAGLISALLFALAHMNINQAAYAFVLGFIFCVINRAAGSIYPSMIIHICINGANLAALLALTALNRALGTDADLTGASEVARNSGLLYYMLGVTLVMAVICGVLAIPCVVWISKHEGNFESLRDMFANRHPRQRWITVSMAVAICILLIIVFGGGNIASYLKGGQ